ncbi:MAG: hypothetical protein GF353_00795, partial [Candidatus Lokiarchaeota archaeon]|nr:hypothetical protein [Candidatus Lokiarchaeota archaeon]
MIKKESIIIGLFISSVILTIGNVSNIKENRTAILREENEDSLIELVSPQASGSTITQKWKWQSPNSISLLKISSNGDYIIAKTDTSNATFFKKDDNSTLWEFETPTSQNIQGIEISYDGNFIVLCDPRQAYLLNSSIENPKKSMWNFTYSSTDVYAYGVDISENGEKICVENNTHIFLLNNSYSKNKLEQWNYNFGPSAEVDDIAISANGNYIAVGTHDGYLYLFNSTDYQDTPMWSFEITSNYLQVVISDDGEYVLVSNHEKEVYLFNTTDHQDLPMWNYTGLSSSINNLAISSTGKNILICERDGIHYLNNTFSIDSKRFMWEYLVDTTV